MNKPTNNIIDDSQGTELTYRGYLQRYRAVPRTATATATPQTKQQCFLKGSPQIQKK